MIHQIPYFERRVVQTCSNPEIHLTRCFGVQMTRNDTQEPAGFRPAGGASCLVNAVGVANVPSLKAPQSNFGVEQSLAEPRMVLV